jgi:hypothetical protein
MALDERSVMETAWDWITVFAFAGLATLLLQRSSEETPKDKMWQYAPPAIGCAVSNYLGNEGHHIFASAVFLAAVAYIVLVLKPELPFKF